MQLLPGTSARSSAILTAPDKVRLGMNIRPRLTSAALSARPAGPALSSSMLWNSQLKTKRFGSATFVEKKL